MYKFTRVCRLLFFSGKGGVKIIKKKIFIQHKQMGHWSQEFYHGWLVVMEEVADPCSYSNIKKKDKCSSVLLRMRYHICAHVLNHTIPVKSNL